MGRMPDIQIYQLIGLVQERTVLWASTTYNYKDNGAKSTAWKEVVDIMNRTGYHGHPAVTGMFHSLHIVLVFTKQAC